MVRNLIRIEHSYINKSHPQFNKFFEDDTKGNDSGSRRKASAFAIASNPSPVAQPDPNDPDSFEILPSERSLSSSRGDDDDDNSGNGKDKGRGAPADPSPPLPPKKSDRLSKDPAKSASDTAHTLSSTKAKD